MFTVRITRSCEAIRPGIAHPVNSWSSLAFVAVAFLMMAHMLKSRRYIANQPLYSLLFIKITGLIGLMSFWAHASLSGLGGWADFMSIYLLVTFVLALGIAWLKPLSVTRSILIWIAINIPLVWAAGQGGAITDYTLMALIIVVIGLEVAAQRQRPQPSAYFFWLAILAVAFGYLLWQLDTQKIWCSPNSFVQLHAAWHLLTALSTWFLYLYLINKLPHQPK